jgi:predicted nucleic acid-binding protein
LAQQYRDILLNCVGFTTIPLSVEISELAAQLRARHNLRTPDAIQLATSISAGATHFVTNDNTLPMLPELNILVLDDLKV